MISFLIAALYLLILLCIVIVYMEVLETRKVAEMLQVKADLLEVQINRIARLNLSKKWEIR